MVKVSTASTRVKVSSRLETIRVLVLLFEEVSVDLKLLLKHHLPPVFDDECVWLQVFGGSEDLPVFLHPCDPPQLQLYTHNHMLMIYHRKKELGPIHMKENKRDK